MINIQYSIEKDFNMLFYNDRGGIKFFQNSDRDSYIRKIEFTIINQKTHIGYSSNEPKKNIDVLNEFLDYFVKTLKSLGIVSIE